MPLGIKNIRFPSYRTFARMNKRSVGLDDDAPRMSVGTYRWKPAGALERISETVFDEGFGRCDRVGEDIEDGLKHTGSGRGIGEVEIEELCLQPEGLQPVH